ncbi:hypothetical protein [Planctomycetes bacterium K23_9]|uniref:FlgN protein n=1 Tax=Stieleria marina TaxID=1930275 RepID=A0A517NSZ4_9BACT|nr:hypothetical protein K239x_22060 [Planctomycetes bacterium K23_9]
MTVKLNEQPDQKLAVLLQRHLALESRLASSLEDLNQATATALMAQGLRGPSAEDVKSLEPMTAQMQQSASEVATARRSLLVRVGSHTGKAYATIKEIFDDLPKDTTSDLDALRADILSRCETAQSNLVNNQAMLHYTFDFHKKYLAGVFQTDCDGQNYRANGQSIDTPRGNLFGRTC